jgi:hypothetical protein
MAQQAQPGRLGRMAEVAADPAQLVLVTTEECHLCEHAHDVLELLGVAHSEVDVSSSEAQHLVEKGIPLAFLPVLTDGERVVAYGRFSERRLRKELGR